MPIHTHAHRHTERGGRKKRTRAKNPRLPLALGVLELTFKNPGSVSWAFVAGWCPPRLAATPAGPSQGRGKGNLTTLAARAGGGSLSLPRGRARHPRPGGSPPLPRAEGCAARVLMPERPPTTTSAALPFFHLPSRDKLRGFTDEEAGGDFPSRRGEAQRGPGLPEGSPPPPAAPRSPGPTAGPSGASAQLFPLCLLNQTVSPSKAMLPRTPCSGSSWLIEGRPGEQSLAPAFPQLLYGF